MEVSAPMNTGSAFPEYRSAGTKSDGASFSDTLREKEPARKIGRPRRYGAPDMSRNTALAGRTVSKGSFNITYDENGYAISATNYRHEHFAGTDYAIQAPPAEEASSGYAAPPPETASEPVPEVQGTEPGFQSEPVASVSSGAPAERGAGTGAERSTSAETGYLERYPLGGMYTQPLNWALFSEEDEEKKKYL